MKRGVVYVVWGEKAAIAAKTSLASLWAVCPEMEVLIVGDHDADIVGQAFGWPKNLVRLTLDVQPFNGAQFLAGRIKPFLYGHTPLFERALYVDADTKFRRAPDVGFKLLDDWDFVVAETGNRSLADQLCGKVEAEKSRQMFGGVRDLLYHNSGMLFWKRNERVERLFKLWSEEWKRFGGWDEQIALLRALARSEVLFLTVPFTWNTNFPSQATLLFHDFGQRTAWKFKRTRGRVMTADELRLLASEMRRQPHVLARGGAMQKEGTKTGADMRKQKLTKPKEAPQNKAISTPRQNKEVDG